MIFKLDIPANRYDLLCLEGIGMALNVFRQKSEYPLFRVVRADRRPWSMCPTRACTRGGWRRSFSPRNLSAADA